MSAPSFPPFPEGRADPDGRRGRDLALGVMVTEPWTDHELIDSGEGRKLERYGRHLLVRPEPQALWRRAAPERWDAAEAEFTGEADEDGPGRWRIAPGSGLADGGAFPVAYGPVRMSCRLTGFRHVGLFPEQRAHWDTAVARIRRMVAAGETPHILNLFGYTGAASLLLAAAGARVTHVDASRKAIAWARENQEASGLAERPIRWICEDARKYAAREVRRGQRYDGVLLDPPKYGRGPKGEVWQILEDLPSLVADVAALVPATGAFVVLTAYAIRWSALAAGELLREAFTGHGGGVDAGELALRETSAGRLLPTSLYARWRGPAGAETVPS